MAQSSNLMIPVSSLLLDALRYTLWSYMSVIIQDYLQNVDHVNAPKKNKACRNASTFRIPRIRKVDVLQNQKPTRCIRKPKTDSLHSETEN